MNYSAGTKGFFEWLRDQQPKLYAAVNQSLQPPVGDFASDTIGFAPMPALSSDIATTSSAAPMTSSIGSAISDVLNIAADAYLTKTQIDAQNKVLDIQLARAQQGLPPLYIGASGSAISSGLSTNAMLLLGGAAVLAYLLIKK